MIKIFTETLPHNKSGKRIIWLKSINCIVKFIYDNIEGVIEIVNYNQNTKQLTIKYNNVYDNIATNNFIAGKIGKILGKRTSEFKIEIGAKFKDDKRDITIIDREYRVNIRKDDSIENQKWYKYHCNKCGYNEGWAIEGSLRSGAGCACCCSNPQVVVKGINDIATTRPNLVKYFVNIEDVYTHTYASHNKVMLNCPDCGQHREMKISDLSSQGFSCLKCGDGIKFPEKMMFSVLEQLKLYFLTQLTKTTFKWCDKYRYDFYFEYDDEQYIIETHGKQHYYDCTWSKVKDVQANDKTKKQLALNNGIKEENYIVIDCRKSKLEWMKQNILNSKLNKLFDLSNIDWLNCLKYSTESLMKKSWELKRKNPRMSTLEIGDILGLDSHTICRYLKIGDKLGYCNYEVRKIINYPIAIYKDKILIGLFKNAQDIEDISEAILGFKLFKNGILKNKNLKLEYKGLFFEDIDINYEKCTGFILNNTKIKYIKPCAKSVICIDTKIKYDQINIASKEYNTSSSNIIACCKGNRNSTGKMRWLYLEDYLHMIDNNYSYEDIKQYIKEKYKKGEIK